MKNKLNLILSCLTNGDLSCLNSDNIIEVSNETNRLLSVNEFSQDDIEIAKLIILISQIVYNNTDKNVLFLDDGVYDLLLEKYKNMTIIFK